MHWLIRSSVAPTAILFLVRATAGHAQGPATAGHQLPEAVPADTAVLTGAIIDAGRVIFHGPGTCHACHGDELEGGPIAPSLRGPKWRHIDGTFEAVLHRIRTGQDGTLMVSYPGGISDSDAVQVATYVYAVSQGKAKP